DVGDYHHYHFPLGGVVKEVAIIPGHEMAGGKVTWDSANKRYAFDPSSIGWQSLRSEEHTSELQSPCNLVCRLLLEKKKLNKPSSYSRVAWRTYNGPSALIVKNRRYEGGSMLAHRSPLTRAD